ncbi:MAG: hypothetical protein AB8G96_07395 [Phycisphaerales bacterium]
MTRGTEPAIRRDAIAELLRRNRVATQSQLAALLEADGFAVPQATISRDLRALGVRKEASGYRLPKSPRAGRRSLGKAARAGKVAAVLAVRRSGATLVLETRRGAAADVAKRLDAADWPGLLGTVAGQTCVIAVAATVSAARELEASLSDRA